MIVTGNGITLVFDDSDEWLDVLDAIMNTPDELDDTIAEHALDTICFLQDEDVQTPMDDIVQYPIMMTLADLDVIG